MGLLNASNDGSRRNHVFAVEFDTAKGLGESSETEGNHIGINFNTMKSAIQKPVAFYNNTNSNRIEELTLDSGEPITVYISYDGKTKILNVTVYPSSIKHIPSKPLISEPIPKLRDIVEENMYIGFTASTGKNKRSGHYIMGWSFASGGEHPVAEPFLLSDLPPLPLPRKKKKESTLSSVVIGLIATVATVVFLLGSLSTWFYYYKKRLEQSEHLEDWEISQPHRHRYKDVYSATDGFSNDRIIGAGGFGTVFRGRGQIAVKKIRPASMQGVREFVAEIESLGGLNHRNLVKLRGWCKHKADLLLIYDYIPNGNLESLIHTQSQSGTVLPWNVRFQIAKGIASGMLYLHEECEQIIVHRDIKPSNIMMDHDMNPRLGDFGLARLYERGSQSHTTLVVGTIGYMAPEITRTGISSTASDVFSYGVLLLEIVSGRKPNALGIFLADWITDLKSNGDVLGAVDPKLLSVYDSEEATIALEVGLRCCNENATSRPTMKNIIKYLNREEQV